MSCITILLPTAAVGQWNPEPACDQPYGDVLTCGLRAGNVRDLRFTTFAPAEREVRFWTVGGLGDPQQLLAINQRGDSVTGRLLLFWHDNLVNDTVATAMCTEAIWQWVGGSVCVGRLAAEQEWGDLLSALDTLGLAGLPGRPVPDAPCVLTLQDGRSVAQPEGWCVMADGREYILEVGAPTVYWRYIFAALPDMTAAGMLRDRSILELLGCAGLKVGDGPCQGAGAER
jgi:hypothetical protein